MRITVEDVHKTYQRGESEVRVLRGISCTFEEGAFHFIVGPSGSGKSSLLYLLGGLDFPTSGEISIDDSPIRTWSESRRNRFRGEQVGFIFQNFNLMSNLNALENVLVPYMPRGLTSEQRKQARELLVRVGLEKRLTHRPSHLSGGEQQRVAIARALLKRPPLILADEPTGELDSQTGREILALLRELSAEHRSTVVIVTHDTSHMTDQDHVHHINDGLITHTDHPTRTAGV